MHIGRAEVARRDLCEDSHSAGPSLEVPGARTPASTQSRVTSFRNKSSAVSKSGRGRRQRVARRRRGVAVGDARERGPTDAQRVRQRHAQLVRGRGDDARHGRERAAPRPRAAAAPARARVARERQAADRRDAPQGPPLGPRRDLDDGKRFK